MSIGIVEYLILVIIAAAVAFYTNPWYGAFVILIGLAKLVLSTS